MGRKLLVIGLDAVEATLLDGLMTEGRLPNLAALAASGQTASIHAECMDTFPGAIWQDILLGQGVGVHGDYYPIRIPGGEAEAAWFDPVAHGGTYVWDEAARRGLDSIVVDAPLVNAYDAGERVTLLTEWHVHDALYGTKSHPPELLGELEGRFGARSSERCDFLIDGTDDSYRSFGEMLVREAAIKADVVRALMAEKPWDLCVVGMGQGHCVGHQMWHFFQAAQHGRPDRGLGDVVPRVYEALDAAVGRIVEAAGSDVDVMVLTSHGMREYFAGPQLVGPVLRALGMGDSRRVPSWLRPIVPSRTIHRVFDRFPQLLRRADAAGLFGNDLTEGIKAVSVRNNRVGAVRLNIIGREPAGAVHPDDADALADEIIAAFNSLRDPATNEPIVRHCSKSAEVYGPDRHPDLPDITIAFRDDLGLIEEADSSIVGRVACRAFTRQAHRTGDHSANSRLWASLRDVSPARLQGLSSTDLAALMLDVVGTESFAVAGDDG